MSRKSPSGEILMSFSQVTLMKAHIILPTPMDFFCCFFLVHLHVPDHQQNCNIKDNLIKIFFIYLFHYIKENHFLFYRASREYLKSIYFMNFISN